MSRIWAIVIISLLFLNLAYAIASPNDNTESDTLLDQGITRNDSSPGLMNSTFPMFKGDPQRTGRCNVDTSDNPGIIKWTFPTDSPSESTPVIDQNGTIYFGTHTGYFFAIYPNGSEKWNFYTGEHIYASGVLDSYGYIYFPCANGYFYSLYTENGTMKWRIPRGVGHYGPVIYNDTIYHYGVGGFCAFDLDGNLLWINSSYNFYRSCPAVGHDGILYIGSYDNYLQAVYPNNGTLKWEFETGYYVSTTPTIDKNGTIYFGCWDGYFYALNPNGTLKWKCQRAGNGEAWYSSPVIDYNEDIIVFDQNGHLCRFDSNGSLSTTWQPGRTKTTPTIDSNNIIFYTGYNFYAVYPDMTGHMVLGPLNSLTSSPVFGPDGTVYIVSSVKGLMAIGEKVPNTPLLFMRSSGNQYNNINWSIANDTFEPMYDIGPASFNILKKMSWEEDFSLLTTVAGTDRLYNDTDVSNGDEYEYYIVAVNDYGESEPSNTVSGIPMTTPSPPKNIGSRTGEGFSLIIWDPPMDDGGSDIIGYKIWKKSSASSEFSFLTDIGSDIFIYNDTEVSNGIRYEYYVTSINSRGSSGPSQIISSIPATVPDSPFLGSNEGNGFIILNWNPPSFTGGREIIGWKLFKGTKSDNKELIVIFNGDILSYSDTEVENGITYHYHLTCNNEIGESQPSNSISGIPIGPPTEPLFLSGTSGNNFAHLTWTKPLSDEGSTILGYIIRSSWVLQGTIVAQEFSVEGEDSSSFNDTTVFNGMTYLYTVVSINSIGESDRSNEVSITPMTIPLPPVDLAVIEGNGFVEISWSEPVSNGGSLLTGYRLFRRIEFSEMIEICTLSPDNLSFNDTELENDVAYIYYIIAENTVGLSEPSSMIRGIPSLSYNPTVPSSPRNLSYRMGKEFVLLSWISPNINGGSEILRYNLYRGNTIEGMTLIGNSQGDILSFNDTDFDPGKEYYYFVVSENDIGESEKSNIISLETEDNDRKDSEKNYWVWIIIIIILILIAVGGSLFFIINRRKEKEISDSEKDIESSERND